MKLVVILKLGCIKSIKARSKEMKMGGLSIDDLAINSDSERLDTVDRLDFVDSLEGH